MNKERQVSKLNEGLDLIFRSKNQQIMLSRLHENHDFNAIRMGQQAVQVITADKKMFTATLEPIPTNQSQFWLVPSVNRPKINPEDHLLLLLDNQRSTAISQVVVDSISGSKVRVVGLDPRRNIRYKTRISAKIRLVSEDCLEKLKSKEWNVSRSSLVLDSFLSPVSGDVQLARDFLTKGGDTPCTDAEVFASGQPIRALVVDISDKGFAVLSADKLDFELLRKNMFIFIDFQLPHVVNDFRITAFAAVRHVRRWKNDVSSIHCMFVEQLPLPYFVI